MTKDEALKLALEALERCVATCFDPYAHEQAMSWSEHFVNQTITAIKEALAQPEQEPVAYDKTEMNCFVQDLYDKKMQEGKHGHYETMFHVVHQAIKKVPPQRTWVGLTDAEMKQTCYEACSYDPYTIARAVEAKLKEKNT